MGGGGNRSRLPNQAELPRQPNWAGREGSTPKKQVLKCMDVTKTNSLQITSHKAVRHINQSQGCC